MPRHIVILVVSVVSAAALAAGLVGLVVTGKLQNTCAYGSGKSRNSCKARPEPDAEALATAIDGRALRIATAAFIRSADGAQPLVGVGLNRWGEVSFALPTGKTGFGVARERFLRFDPQGRPLDENLQAQYEDAAGSTPFGVDMIRPEILRDSLARVDRPRGFINARLEPSFGDTGLAWRLTYVTRGEGGGQGTMFAMAADGAGLCRLNDSSSTPGIPACNLARLPATPFAGASDDDDQQMRPMAIPMPAQDPALKRQFEQMACVKNAQGNVVALRRCVE